MRAAIEMNLRVLQLLVTNRDGNANRNTTVCAGQCWFDDATDTDYGCRPYVINAPACWLCALPIAHCATVQRMGTAVFNRVQLDRDRIRVASCMATALVIDALALYHDTCV